MMFCPHCDTNLDDVAPDQPCPSCGGGSRSAMAFAGVATASVSVGEVSLKVTKGDHRPWIEKWRYVLQCRHAIADTYDGEGDMRRFGNDEVDRRVNNFFTECDHVRDWLAGDLVNLPGITKHDLEQTKLSGPLEICYGICNTHKHHTVNRCRPARIRDTMLAPTGARVTIEIDWATPAAKTIDVADG